MLVTGRGKVSKEERQTWKIMFLSLMYGGGVRTIQEQFGVDQAEAKRMIRKFHNGWPAVRELSDSVQRVAARRGYIIGIDGRHLHPEQFGEHKLLNKLIQGSAAGIMKRALLNIGRHLWKDPLLESRPIATVHDSVLWDGPVEEVEVLHNVVPELMRAGFEHVHETVPILVDHEVSTTNWAEKIAYDEWRNTGPERPDAAVHDQGQRPAPVV